MAGNSRIKFTFKLQRIRVPIAGWNYGKETREEWNIHGKILRGLKENGDWLNCHKIFDYAKKIYIQQSLNNDVDSIWQDAFISQ